jgi:predicted alpha/beta-fold hydrolase
MPALKASRPTSSSIFAPSPTGLTGSCTSKFYLERLQSEIQAIRAHQGDVVLDSRGECCSNARVNAGFTLTYCAALSIFLPEVGKKYEKRER